jgi:hypothetical protein
MNIKNLLCVVSAMALFGAVTAQAQGLTDLAKAEKKRRAQVQKSGGAAKVYTESDRSSSSDAVSVANAETTGTAAAPGWQEGKDPGRDRGREAEGVERESHGRSEPDHGARGPDHDQGAQPRLPDQHHPGPRRSREFDRSRQEEAR